MDPNKLKKLKEMGGSVTTVKDFLGLTDEDTAAIEVRSFVVHREHSSFDVYVGRPSIWGNKFVIGKDGTREEVIAKYEAWVLDRPAFVEMIKRELKGKVLACWCAPDACHADVLARIANKD